jgi:protein-S-isoprenylcysteine O-methyltransferase Ste14
MKNEPEIRPNVYPWPPLLLVLAIAAAIFLRYAAPVPWPGLDDGPARVIGLSIGGAGLALLIWAMVTLKRHDTTAMPHKAASHLVTSGPFRFVRNPIYLADVMMFMGAAEITKNVWFATLGFAFAVLVTWLAIIPEEHHLEAKFGDDYRDYKSKTRRWI